MDLRLLPKEEESRLFEGVPRGGPLSATATRYLSWLISVGGRTRQRSYTNSSRGLFGEPAGFLDTLINSGSLIGLARNRCPWIRRPDLASAIVTSAVRTQSVSCAMPDRLNPGGDFAAIGLGIAISSRIRSG